MRILPAIDIFRGACVRLTQGNFSRSQEYPATPREMAERFAAAGAEWIHVVDLEGAREGRVTNWDSILAIRSLGGVALQFGGGVRTTAEVARLAELGVDRIIVGSVALRRRRLFRSWLREFGAGKFRVALDVRDGLLALAGWQESASRTIDDVVPGLIDDGVTQILSTDIGRDGTLAGPNLALYEGLAGRYPSVEWYASGGVRSLDDIEMLRATHVAGVIVGKAIYEGAIPLAELFRC